MSGYYILAIVFIAVAAGLVVTYHLLRFLWGKNVREKRKGWIDNKGRLYRLKNLRFKKFLVAIIIIGVIGAVMFGLGAGFVNNAEREIVKYKSRYSMAIMLKDGEFYKYSGDQIAKETVDIAEWAARVNWSVERYGRFSPYWSLKGRVHLTIGG